MRFTYAVRMVTLASLAALALVVQPAQALAQGAPKVTFVPAVAPLGQVTTTQTSQPQEAAADSPYWTLIGGIEFDTDGMMYAQFGPTWNKPLRENLKLQISVRPNYLRYEFEENGGTTRVSGPGVSTKVGLEFGDRNTVGIGVGPSFKWRGETFTDAAGNETEVGDDSEVGLSFGADAYLNPTDRDNVHALINYNTADDNWLWSRLGYKRQITNLDWRDTWAHHVGGEGIFQGNDDIKIVMFGGLVEFVHAPSTTAIMLRAGFKRSSFDVGDDKTGPYFGVNFYRRLGQ